MKQYSWLVSISLVAAVVCLCGVSAGRGNAQESSAAQGVTKVLTMQSDAWNRGDLDSFMTGYLNSKDTSSTSSCCETWGYEALRQHYQKVYGSDHKSMGKLTLSRIKVFDLGKANALCIGHWHLERADHDPLDGVFSLVLVKTSSGWKIMHDHTSTTEKKTES